MCRPADGRPMDYLEIQVSGHGRRVLGVKRHANSQRVQRPLAHHDDSQRLPRVAVDDGLYAL